MSKHVGTDPIKKPLGFPSMIFGIIQNQQDVLTPKDVFKPTTTKVVFTSKFHNSELHINDLVEIFDDDALPQVLKYAKSKNDGVADDDKKEVTLAPDSEDVSTYLDVAGPSRTKKTFASPFESVDKLIDSFQNIENEISVPASTAKANCVDPS